MQTTRIGFDQLSQEFEIIAREGLNAIKGGLVQQNSQYEYAIDPNGDWYWRVVGDEIWVAGKTLNEVEIEGHKSSFNWGYFSYISPFGYESGGGYSGDDNGVSGSSGVPPSSNLWSPSSFAGYIGMVFQKTEHS